jgi:hypothetical protein
MNAKTKTLVEHYVYATVAAGVAIWQTGNHDIKKVAWAALIGVLGPVAKAAIDKAREKFAVAAPAETPAEAPAAKTAKKATK